MKRKNKSILSREGRNAEKAMKEAVADIIKDHKLKRIPLVVWRNNQVVKILP